jgi:hypothetical protein
MVAGCSRSVAVAAWHAILESACEAWDGGHFQITPRRVAILLAEPIATLEALFAAFADPDIRLVTGSCVTAWSKRQWESDSSTERSRRHRQNKRQRQGNGDATLHGRDATAPETDAEAEAEAETEPFPPPVDGVTYEGSDYAREDGEDEF